MIEIKKPLPEEVMETAARRIGYIGHSLRLSIIEFLDVNGPSNVSEMIKHLSEEQVIISQSLQRLKRDGVVTDTRNGRYVVYSISENYPHLLLECMRKRYSAENSTPLMTAENKTFLPKEFVEDSARRIKSISHRDKMRILEAIVMRGSCSVSEIMEAVNLDQIAVSQILKYLRENGVVEATRQGQKMIYRAIVELPRTLLSCIHWRYDSLDDKSEF